MSDFEREVVGRIAANGNNTPLRNAARAFMDQSIAAMYSYNFSALGRPIIQYPQDMVAMQELIWATRPDVIVETGIAHGGSLILSASMLTLLDYCDALAAGELIDPARPKRKVVAVDIDIRAHNRTAIEAHPMANRIEMIQGSAIDPAVVAKVKQGVGEGKKVLVSLDSNHTHDHVLAELEAYGPLVSVGSYCVVFDTIVEDLSANASANRSWGPGDNPKTAVWEYLKRHAEFEVDRAMDDRLQISVAPNGFLRRVS